MGLGTGTRGWRPALARCLLVVASVGGLVACSTGGSDAGSPTAAGESASPSGVEMPLPTVSITPVAASVDVPPDAPVVVSAVDGTLSTVTVTDAAGGALPGTMSPDSATWTSAGRLAPANSYTVSAVATDVSGRSVTGVSQFTTLTPAAALTTSISPLKGTTVGVGMPIIVRLSEPVVDRAAVQSALAVTTSVPVEGAWSWRSDEELQWRPKDYWPANINVSLAVGLTGVNAGGGVWGDETRTVDFAIGASTVSVVDVQAKTLTVTRDGQVLRTVPVTTGKPGFLTRGGTKVISEKHRNKVMDAATTGVSANDPEYYRVEVEYALRVTWSGEFLHAAPWSVGSQGSANVSHGCVGMSMSDGQWFFEQSQVGDIVQVVGSDRPLEDANGWTAWNVPWDQWRAGSALPA